MFDTFVGQQHTKTNLELLVGAVKNGRQMPHLGLYGPTGSGKSTLAELIAEEIGAEQCVAINAVSILTPAHLRNLIAPALKNYIYDKKYIIIIDEAHALDEKIQTLLLTALEKPAILSTPVPHTIKIPGGKTLKRGDILREKLPESISFIFCTTDKSSLLDTLCNRLHPLYLDDYTIDEKVQYIRNTLIKFDTTIEDSAAELMAKGAKNMRHLAKLCDRLMDYKLSYNVASAVFSDNEINGLFKILGIDAHGRDKNDIKYIEYVGSHGPISITNIAQYLNMSSKDVIDKVEPFLVRSGWINITKRGRELTDSAIILFYKDKLSNISQHGKETILNIMDLKI